MNYYKKMIGSTLTKLDDQFLILKGVDLYRTNEVGARIFDLCNGSNSSDYIVETLSKFYSVDKSEIMNDLDIYIDQLLEWNLIKKVEAR